MKKKEDSDPDPYSRDQIITDPDESGTLANMICIILDFVHFYAIGNQYRYIGPSFTVHIPMTRVDSKRKLTKKSYLLISGIFQLISQQLKSKNVPLTANPYLCSIWPLST